MCEPTPSVLTSVMFDRARSSAASEGRCVRLCAEFFTAELFCGVVLRSCFGDFEVKYQRKQTRSNKHHDYNGTARQPLSRHKWACAGTIRDAQCHCGVLFAQKAVSSCLSMADCSSKCCHELATDGCCEIVDGYHNTTIEYLNVRYAHSNTEYGDNKFPVVHTVVSVRSWLRSFVCSFVVCSFVVRSFVVRSFVRSVGRSVGQSVVRCD